MIIFFPAMPVRAPPLWRLECCLWSDTLRCGSSGEVQKSVSRLPGSLDWIPRVEGDINCSYWQNFLLESTKDYALTEASKIDMTPHAFSAIRSHNIFNTGCRDAKRQRNWDLNLLTRTQEYCVAWQSILYRQWPWWWELSPRGHNKIFICSGNITIYLFFFKS